MKKRIVFLVICIAVAAVLGVVSYFLLPDTVIMQVSSDGTANTTMPKLPALLIPFLITVAGGVLAVITPGERIAAKYYIISCVGIAAFILTLIFNLLNQHSAV